jgi:hypothetical protein
MGGKHLLQAVVEDVRLYAAPAVLCAETPVTRRASPDLLSAKLDEFRVPACARQRLEHLPEQDLSVPSLARTSIYGYSFHASSS